MKQRLTYKQIAKTTLAILLTAAMAPVQGKTDLNELANELEIMTSILNTALRQDSKTSIIKTRSIDVKYLANQGVVFDVSTSGINNSFNFEFLSLPSAPHPPTPPISGNSFQEKWIIEIDDHDWDEMAHEAMEKAREALEEAREKMREIQEQNREYSWELRDYSRKQRDLEFEMRNADKERKSEIQKEINELKKDKERIELRQKEAQEFAAQLEQEEKQKAAEKSKALKKQVDQFTSGFEANVTSALCKYGAGIKALPVNENVTFILNDFVSESRKSRQDKFYVFSQKDIQDCVKDKLDSKKLLAKAEIYTF